ncbi:MAG: hypothetical protein JWL74_1713, partial [Alphaproteobacteria bacterium]|nr:hypothetical protein [Alphaproteobacteria bacterium]
MTGLARLDVVAENALDLALELLAL